MAPKTPNDRSRAGAEPGAQPRADRATPAEDLALVRASLAGDRGSSEALARRLECVAAILASKNRAFGRRLDAEELADVTQDVLMIIWRKRAQFAGDSTLTTWAYRICVFELLNALRRKRTKDERDDALVDAAQRKERELLPPNARGDLVHLALDRVPAKDAEVVRRKQLDGLTFEEIGDALSISPNTAKTRYYRGLERLREIIAPLLGGKGA